MTEVKLNLAGDEDKDNFSGRAQTKNLLLIRLSVQSVISPCIQRV